MKLFFKLLATVGLMVGQLAAPIHNTSAPSLQERSTPMPTATEIATETPPVSVTPTPADLLSNDIQSFASPDQVNPLAGTAYYVNSATGNDSNSCTTIASPCQHIQEAVDKAGVGDVIYTASGTYLFSTNGTPNVVIINKDITLSGGWNPDFTSQNGASTIDGADANNGILAVSGTVIVENFIIENATSSNSGAIYITNGNFTLKKSTLRNNLAIGNGAGIYLDNGALNIINSTISGNTADGSGGGIYSSNYSGTSVTIQNSTIAYNTAPTGGGVSQTNGTYTITNTIIANNSSSTSGPDCNGVIAAANYNIIENMAGCAITSESNNLNVDPQIDSSLTGDRLAHMLIAGSPAINAGTASGCPSTDQQDVARPQGSSCDIGSIEHISSGVSSINIISGSNQESSINTAFSSNLAALVLDENDSPVSGVDVTFTAPPSGASGVFSASGTNTTTVTTGVNGVATASTFTANGTIGTYAVTASATGYSSVEFQVTNSPARGDYLWAKGMGGASYDEGHSIAVDSSGNSYTTGYFQGTADFDPGTGTTNLTSMGGRDMFISKLDSNGNFVWAKSMGGTGNEQGNSIALDSSGNIYTMGDFWGTADFDPGAGTAYLTSTGGSYDIFVSKLDGSGNFVWAKNMGGTSSDFGLGIVVDSSFNVYTTGYFYSAAADFDPGADTFNLTSAGYSDIFVSKLDSNGGFVWAKSMGGAGYDYSFSITVDSSDNIHTTGDYEGTADFDPGTGTFNLTSGGGFISKLDGNGDFIWAKGMGNSGISIAVDSNGNVFTMGKFEDTVDFDPGTGTANLTSAGGRDIFVSKLDGSGNFIWAKGMGGTDYDYGNDIAVDSSGSVYTTGTFYSPADFDPGTGTANLTSAGAWDVFVSKLNSYGTFVWAKSMGGTNSDEGLSIALDSIGNIYMTGIFNGTADFDPGASTANLTSAGSSDVFVSKLGNDGVTPTVASFTVPSTSSSFIIPITAFTASDAGGVGGYLITTSSTPPLAGNSGWSVAAPTTYTIGAEGSYNLYPWAKDMSGNVSLVFGSPASVTVDLPASVSMSSTAANPTNASPITVSVTFSESVTGFTSDDIIAGNGMVSAFAGSGASYTFNLTPSANGPVTADIAASAAQDSAGNDTTAASQFSRAYDATTPSVTSTSPVSASASSTALVNANAANVDFIVTFSESVTGVNEGDFTLTVTGVSGAAVSGFSGSGSTYTVTVDTGSGSGSIRLNVVDDGTIVDLALNPLGGAGAGNGDFNDGQTYPVTNMYNLLLPLILR